jgi:membrane-associated phospholipid phosphatase
MVTHRRPDVVPHLSIATSPSFPSGHSMLAAVLYLTRSARQFRRPATVLLGGSRV